jgi:hypothetical protein
MRVCEFIYYTVFCDNCALRQCFIKVINRGYGVRIRLDVDLQMFSVCNSTKMAPVAHLIGSDFNVMLKYTPT